MPVPVSSVVRSQCARSISRHSVIKVSTECSSQPLTVPLARPIRDIRAFVCRDESIVYVDVRLIVYISARWSRGHRGSAIRLSKLRVFRASVCRFPRRRINLSFAFDLLSSNTTSSERTKRTKRLHSAIARRGRRNRARISRIPRSFSLSTARTLSSFIRSNRRELPRLATRSTLRCCTRCPCAHFECSICMAFVSSFLSNASREPAR